MIAVIAVLLFRYSRRERVFDGGLVSVVATGELTLPDTLPQETPSPTPDADRTVPTVKSEDFSGGKQLQNNTSYEIDASSMLKAGCKLRLSSSGPQILIIHTHSTEAYSPAGLDKYEATGDSRTLDSGCNVIRVGTELQKVLEECGLNVIHDCGVYDYPSYAGSYSRTEEAISAILEKNPSISVVIDLHRDAIGDDGIIYKTKANEDGVCSAQLMMILGSDDSGLEHPDWRENLSFALYLQNTVNGKYPSLMRTMILVPYRYNQHLTHGSIILEVGSNGNTLREALAAVRLFGDAVGPALSALVE